jgi:tetratricopeptide (TPR) repeat protein
MLSSVDSAVRGFFEGAAKRTRLMLGILAVVVALSALGALFLNRQAAQSSAASNALYLAQKSVDADLKAASAALPPVTAPSGAKAPATPDPDAAVFKKLDVDAKFADSLKKLHAVAEQYPGTRAAFEANLQVGDLYFNHGEAPKAVEWYQKALGGAPDKLAKVFALSALGYANEGAGKFSEALASFQKAMDLGEVSSGVKGDVMLGVARSYEEMGDTAKARAMYDQIISQQPGTEFAKTAESDRALLK